MMDLRELYQDIILDHGRHPRNLRVIPGASHHAHGHNPLCGDQVTVFLLVEDGIIADLSFEGRGCAICTASSSLMTEVLKGKTLAEAESLFKTFHAKVTGGEAPPLALSLEDDAERLEPLSGVKAYPVRVKCATLAWRTFEAALAAGKGAGEAESQPVKTE